MMHRLNLSLIGAPLRRYTLMPREKTPKYILELDPTRVVSRRGYVLFSCIAMQPRTPGMRIPSLASVVTRVLVSTAFT